MFAPDQFHAEHCNPSVLTLLMKWLLYSYISLVIILHLIPTPGRLEISSAEVGFIRMDYLLHVLVFLPWMFLVGSVRSQGLRDMMQGTRTREQGPGALFPTPDNRQQATDNRIRFFLVWMAIGIALAIGAEGIQYWLPHRTYNPWDAVFNALGVVIGAVLILGGWWIAGRKSWVL